MRNKVFLILAVPVLVLAFAGCGGDEKAEEPAPVVQAEPEPVHVPMPAGPDDVSVYFKWSNTVLTDQEKAKLRAPAAKIVQSLNHIREHPEGNQPYVVLVTGVTSTDGTVEANDLVGSKRANNTAAALVKLGVPAKKIRILTRSRGMGKDCWRADVQFVSAEEARMKGAAKYSQ
jgi:outer membrane protein OmpA-like peptidoglycan-associated protein